MGIASLVIGIIAIVASFIPCAGLFTFIPAIVGLILGAVGRSQLKKKGEPTGVATAGLVLNILAVAWIVIFLLVLGGLGTGAAAAASSGF